MSKDSIKHAPLPVQVLQLPLYYLENVFPHGGVRKKSISIGWKNCCCHVQTLALNDVIIWKMTASDMELI